MNFGWHNLTEYFFESKYAATDDGHIDSSERKREVYNKNIWKLTRQKDKVSE